MNSLSTFRVALVALALIIGFHAFASTLADIGSLDPPAFPSDPAKISSPSAGAVSGWLEVLSPFRSDLEAKHAFVAALQALQSGKAKPVTGEAANNVRAQAKVKQALSIAPQNSELWLALALLRAQRDPHDPALIEALKMAYFTAPTDAQLMPVRLDTATTYEALADPDVKELARGDVRLMLKRQPELKAAVVAAYRRASNLGKVFLEQAVQSIDPSFLPSLRG